MVEVKFTGADRNEGTSANDRQVGGSHYAGKVQHWDLIELHGVGYLEGCATKYIQRWRLKNGVQDLNKAAHYVDKLLELHLAGRREPRGSVPVHVVQQFCQDHKLDQNESAAVDALCRWHHVGDLVGAQQNIALLLRGAEQQG
jgi:hypothetical protein